MVPVVVIGPPDRPEPVATYETVPAPIIDSTCDGVKSIGVAELPVLLPLMVLEGIFAK